MSALLAEIGQLQAMPASVSDCHAEICRLRAELRCANIAANDYSAKLSAALDAEARSNARNNDIADRFASFVAERKSEWIGLFSQAGAAKLCRAAGIRVTKRAGQLPTKGSLLSRFDNLSGDQQAGAIADLFDQLLPEDFEQ